MAQSDYVVRLRGQDELTGIIKNLENQIKDTGAVGATSFRRCDYRYKLSGSRQQNRVCYHRLHGASNTHVPIRLCLLPNSAYCGNPNKKNGRFSSAAPFSIILSN